MRRLMFACSRVHSHTQARQRLGSIRGCNTLPPAEPDKANASRVITSHQFIRLFIRLYTDRSVISLIRGHLHSHSVGGSAFNTDLIADLAAVAGTKHFVLCGLPRYSVITSVHDEPRMQKPLSCRHYSNGKKEELRKSFESDIPPAAKHSRSYENCFQKVQEPIYPDLTHWLAFDLVTAGRQDIELGRDQTPIVKMSAVLGSISDNKVVDRLTINLQSKSFLHDVLGPLELSTSLSSSPPLILAAENQEGDSRMRNQWSASGEEVHTVFTDPNACMQGDVSFPLDTVDVYDMKEKPSRSNAFSPGLAEAMNLMTHWLREHGVPLDRESENSHCVIITDGHVPMRNVLHPQAAYLNVDRSVVQQPLWHSYVNVLDWCAKDVNILHLDNNNPRLPSGVKEACANLGLPSVDPDDETISRVERIASIVQALISRDVPMCERQLIRTGYQHKVFPRSIHMEDSCVVEVRQVPWSATPAILASFFSGLNIIPGGVAIRLTEGRRSNTAIIAFESQCNAQLALARHQHQLCGGLLLATGQEASPLSDRGGRDGQTQPVNKPVMLQVYSASAREFLQCAGCDQAPVADFLNQLTNGEQVVVRIRGLPYTATKQQIMGFFDAVQVKVFLQENGIYLVAYPEGRPTGDAFVLFNDDLTATKALKRHKDYLGDRYVELFKASPSEMVQVCFNVAQQSQGSNTTNKSGSLSADIQNRSRTSVNSTMADWPCWAHYLLQAQSLATPWKSLLSVHRQSPAPSVLAQNTVPHLGLPPTFLPIGSSWTDSFSVGSMFGMNLPSIMQPQVVLSGSSRMPSLSPAAISNRPLLEPVTQDLKDPTDPDCPYARQLPPGGVTGLVQMSGLPLETSRHDIRLYLGPVNMSKVYRMRQMAPKTNQSTSTWLISVIHTMDGLQLIRDLVHRPFRLINPLSTDTERVLQNVPTFALYHIGPDKTPVSIPLHETFMGIPWNRIYGTYPETQSPDLWLTASVSNRTSSTIDPGNTFGLSPDEKTPEAHSNSVGQATNHLKQNQLLRAIMAQTPLLHDPFSVGKSQPPCAPSNIAQLPLQTPALHGFDSPTDVMYQLQQAHSSTSLALPDVPNFTRIHSALPMSCGTPGAASNIVLLAGVPLDATTEELTTLLRPVSRLLTSPPQFTLYQLQPNGTATFLATFSTALEAHAVALYCSNGILRNRPCTAHLAPLPIGAITQVDQLLEPLTTECRALTAMTNLLFPQPLLSNANLPP
ncbi:unnamed protein product [Dicrocoelium dendriticum]|nr:unnamed protein product [Dicrocoelium dendriticum]